MTTAVNPSPAFTPAGPKRQQRGIQLPQLLMSLLVVALFSLLAVWWQASTTQRSPVLALGNDVAVGEPITLADITEIFISTDVAANVRPAGTGQEFVGTLPVTDLAAGTILTYDMFRRAVPLQPGQAIAGLVLDGTRAPQGLEAGDRVQVLDSTEAGGVEVLSTDARVDRASYHAGQLTITLRLDVNAAQLVQLNSGSVVLIEVDNSSAPSWERPASEDPS